MKVEAGSPEKLVGALTSGLRVLRYLSEANRPVGVSHVARDLALNPSTTFNLLKTLVHEGFAKFNEDEKSYAIDLGIIGWLNNIIQSDWLVMITRPKLEMISSEFDTTASLWSRVREDRMILVDRADNAAAIRLYMSVGQRLPVYIAAFGRCMAAHDDIAEDELRRHFAELRWQSPPTFSYYLEGVNQCRRSGYAVDRDNFVRGVTTISAPILDHHGAAVAAISIASLSGQLLEDRINEVGMALKHHAEDISRTVFPVERRRTKTLAVSPAPKQVRSKAVAAI